MEGAWDTIELSPPTHAALKDLNFTHMTSVQAECIPLFVSRKDVAVEAMTGSGKTLAFVIPILEILLKREHQLTKNEVGALIITPTRELAQQIYNVFEGFLKHMPQFSLILIIGGQKVRLDLANYKNTGGNIIVATPGRLESLLSKKDEDFDLAACIQTLEVLVLDEADRLLDMGFETSLNRILSFLPSSRTTALFSATQTRRLNDLIRAGLQNPVSVSVKEKNVSNQVETKTPSTLSNYYTVCKVDDKFNVLVTFLKKHQNLKIMVFFSTCDSVKYFTAALKSFLKDFTILGLHGKMKNMRHVTFGDFRNLESGILLCTDVMARGVDIPEVHWVVQYDPSHSSSDFIHRCGRTARIGNLGNALLFLEPREIEFVKFVETKLKVYLEKMDIVNTEDLLPRMKQMALEDRDFYDLGVQAFKKHRRSYGNHECSNIFRQQELDIGLLARSFALVHFPKHPQYENRYFNGFTPMDIDPRDIPYKDPHKEKIRQAKLQIFEQTGQWSKKLVMPSQLKKKHKGRYAPY